MATPTNKLSQCRLHVKLASIHFCLGDHQVRILHDWIEIIVFLVVLFSLWQSCCEQELRLHSALCSSILIVSNGLKTNCEIYQTENLNLFKWHHQWLLINVLMSYSRMLLNKLSWQSLASQLHQVVKTKSRSLMRNKSQSRTLKIQQKQGDFLTTFFLLKCKLQS